MNIPDEYFTDEAPTDPGLYAVKRPDGIWFTYDQSDHRPARNSSLGFRFCRLAPAADNHKLNELVNALRSDVVTFGKMGARLKAENEKLRGWVRDAYEEGVLSPTHWCDSTAKARLEGRSE